MSFSDMCSVIIHSLIPAAPYLAAWSASVVFSTIMIRRVGGRAEHLLLTGSCLMLASKLCSVPAVLITPLLINSGWNTNRALPVLSGFNLFTGLISLAGIVCLVYSFWIKFQVKPSESY